MHEDGGKNQGEELVDELDRKMLDHDDPRGAKKRLRFCGCICVL